MPPGAPLLLLLLLMAVLTSTSPNFPPGAAHHVCSIEEPEDDSSCPPICSSSSSSLSSSSPPSSSSSSSSWSSKKSTKENKSQCLYYLQDSHKEEICRTEVTAERRRVMLHRLRMPHCCEHALDQTLPEDAFHGDSNTCRTLLTRLQELDNFAKTLTCTHADLLTRYDCSQNYSIVHTCNNCKDAYRRWVCSSLVPHYTRSGDRMRPCLRVCQDVEQQCPYLLPDQTILPGEAAHPTPQYAGEPTFLCLDQNIPETGEQRKKSSRGEDDCCYKYCPISSSDGVKTGVNIEKIVCEHCPGRGSFSGEKTASASFFGRGTASLRTFNQTFYLVWTAWIIFLNLHLETDKTENLLLVLCEYGIRTTMIIVKIIIKIIMKLCL